MLSRAGMVRPRHPTGAVPPDVNRTGNVSADDLIAVILAWGDCPPAPTPCTADVTGDNTVNVDDLIAVILDWGMCP
jgi:hypothetical protein